MWNIIQLYRDLAAHPIAKAVLTVIGVSTAFMIGALLNLDVGFLPLIHKTDMLILMSFYGSVLTVGFRLASAAIELYITAFKTLFLGNDAPHAAPSQTESREPADHSEQEAPGLTTLLAVSVFTVGTIVLISSYIVFYLPDTALIKQFPAFCALLASLVFLAISSIGNNQKVKWNYRNINNFTKAMERLKKFGEKASIPFIIISGLLSASSAGFFYIDILRNYGPRVILTLDNDSKRTAAIAFPATDGLIVFFEGEDDSSYIPQSSIKMVTGSPTLRLKPRSP